MRGFLISILAFLPIANTFADTEPNDTWQTASPLSQDTSAAGTQSDDDWYVINAAIGNRVLIDLTFTHADGDIQLGFYDDSDVASDGAFPSPARAGSLTNTDHEFIDNNISVRGPGTYYIHVFGGDQGNSYTLTWTELAGADDGFEENDSNSAPAAISDGVVAFGSQSDLDWYSIDVAKCNVRVLVSLRLKNTGALDISLHDIGGTQLDSSTNPAGENEAIDFDLASSGASAGTYHLQITGSDSGDAYALDWEIIAPPNSAPIAVANLVSTNANTAHNFAASDFTFTDSDCDSLISATLSNLSLGGGTLAHSGGTTVNSGDTLTAAELATLVYTPAPDATGSPLASFDFAVNDIDAGTTTAQMGINVTAAQTTPVVSGSSGGALSPLWLCLLMLAGFYRRIVVRTKY